MGVAATILAGGALPGLEGCVSVPDDGLALPCSRAHVADWRDEVIYQVLVTDRYADGDLGNDYSVQPGALGHYQGGDWQGMIDHMAYFQALGVTTIWISPVVKNVFTNADVDGYHASYWAQDLTQLNPYFGDLATLRAMVAAAHDASIKVVLDIVCNHMGQIFFYDQNLNGEPRRLHRGRRHAGRPRHPGQRVRPWTGTRSACRRSARTAPTVARPSSSSTTRRPTRSLRPASSGRPAVYHGMGHILDFNDEDQVIPRRLHGRAQGSRDRSSPRCRRSSRRTT